MSKNFRENTTDNFLHKAKHVYNKNIKNAQNRKNLLRGGFNHVKPATH